MSPNRSIGNFHVGDCTCHISANPSRRKDSMNGMGMRLSLPVPTPRLKFHHSRVAIERDLSILPMLHFQVLEALGEEEERVPKRIVKEIALIEKYREKIRSEGIMMVTKGDKRHFFATIDGPADSPYAGGKFHLEMYLLEGYPFKAPKVRFLTPIYHPNIDKEGRISLDVLQDNWSPALSAFKAVYCIRMLLYAPNPDDPLDCKFAAHWKQDMTAARQRAQEW